MVAAKDSEMGVLRFNNLIPKQYEEEYFCARSLPAKLFPPPFSPKLVLYNIEWMILIYIITDY